MINIFHFAKETLLALLYNNGNGKRKIMMKKLTYKKLYSLILVVTLLTILGMIFTCSSYYQLQKHAVDLAENQLSTLNHSAINVVKTKFRSYQQTLNLLNQK